MGVCMPLTKHRVKVLCVPVHHWCGNLEAEALTPLKLQSPRNSDQQKLQPINAFLHFSYSCACVQGYCCLFFLLSNTLSIWQQGEVAVSWGLPWFETGLSVLGFRQ